MSRFLRFALSTTIMLLCFACHANALVVNRVHIEGTVRISDAFVLSHWPFSRGQTFSEKDLQEAMKDLFATGIFADVKGRIVGNVLYITVVENPILNRITFEGNRKLDDEALLSEIGLKSREVYTPYRVQKAAQKIKDLYRLRGYVSAVVTPKIIRRPQGRVDLIFEIKDGVVQRVERILFVGNKNFSDSDLRAKIITRESRWWRFLSAVDNYEPDRLTYDRELLYKHYMDEGYADVEVYSTLTELSQDQRDFYITFRVQEGAIYRFGDVLVTSQVPGLDSKSFISALQVKKGNKYSRHFVEKTTYAINRLLSEKGHFAVVEPRYKKHAHKKLIDVTFEIVTRKPIYVSEVIVRGNLQTNDKVIRRESLLAPGDPITPFPIEKTRQRLMNLDFFKKVDVLVEEDEELLEKRQVIIDVEDKSTGEFMLEAGYRTHVGPFFSVKAAERNFLGRGQELAAKATVARRAQSLVLDFTEPYFMNRRLEFGVDSFVQRSQQDTLGSFKGGYTYASFGGGGRLGFYLNDHLFERVRYSLRKEQFKNKKTDSVFYASMGNDVVSQVGHDLIYDRRDSAIVPTEGGYCVLATNLAGLGGTVSFLNNDLTGGYYWSLDEDKDLIFRIRTRYGFLVRIAKPLRVVDHFFMGGESVRGFDEVGLGPRDSKTGDAIGGRQSFHTNLELSHPIGKKGMGLSGYIFNDWGSLWSSAEKDGAYGDQIVGDNFYLRTSVGFGLRFQSPFGLIGFSIGYPLRKLKGVDKQLIFRFNMGTEF